MLILHVFSDTYFEYICTPKTFRTSTIVMLILHDNINILVFQIHILKIAYSYMLILYVFFDHYKMSLYCLKLRSSLYLSCLNIILNTFLK